MNFEQSGKKTGTRLKKTPKKPRKIKESSSDAWRSQFLQEVTLYIWNFGGLNGAAFYVQSVAQNKILK